MGSFIKLRYGNTNTYYINGLLLDTDMPGTLQAFFREIKKCGVALSDIRFVMATHYHPDHMGLMGELAELGVRPVIFENQWESVHYSDPIFARQRGLSYRPLEEESALKLGLSEGRDFLRGLGIQGEIVPTLSHSPDGIALILDDGHCFVGDLEPMSFIPAYENNERLAKDWELILSLGAKEAHFGHINDQDLTEASF